MRVVDLSDPPDPLGQASPPGVVVAVGHPESAEDDYWLDACHHPHRIRPGARRARW